MAPCRDLLDQHMRQTLGAYVLKTTGIPQQKRDDPLQYVAILFSRLRTVEFLKQLNADCDCLRAQHNLNTDPSAQKNLLNCFNVIVERLAKDALDEIAFAAVRKCFISLAAEIESLQNDHALNVLHACIDLQAGELLVLQAYYEAENIAGAFASVQNWMAALSQHTGVASQLRLKIYTDSLIQKKLLAKKEIKKITSTPSHRLTALGTATALSIAVGDKILHSM